jgi:PAS domain S-box-containing protein
MKKMSQLPDRNQPSILSQDERSIEQSVIENLSDCQSKFFITLLETIPNPAFCKDAQGKYTGCNKAFEELLGLKQEEILNKTVYDMGPKEIDDQYCEKDQELFERPGKQRYEGQVKDKDGNIRYVIFDKATITGTNGRVEGIVGVISDITQRKQAEQDVCKQQDMLNILLDALTHPFIVIDASDYTIKLSNSFARSSYNINLNSKCYEASHGLCEPCCGSEHPCPMNEIKQTGEPIKVEHLHIDSNGKTMHVEVNAYPIFDELGNLDSIIEYATDITERKQILVELQKSREQFMLAINGSNDGIWDWDLHNNFLFLSPKWKQMIGYEDHELPNMFSTFADRMHPDDSIRVQENLSKYLKGEIPTYSIEFRFQHKDGSHIWILARGEALRDENGILYRMAGSHTDITEIKKAQEELFRREARLKSLVDILQSRHDSVQEFLDFALNEAIKLTESKIGYIYYYNEAKNEFTLNTWSKDVMKECAVVQPQTVYKLEDTGIWGEAVRQRKTIILNDLHAPNPLRKGYPQGHVELHRFMTVPIFRNDKIVGVVGVANKEIDYNETDTLQLTLLMDSVWNIVGQVGAEEALRESEEKFRGLFENAMSGVALHEMVRDEEGNPVDYVFLEVNDAFEKQTGLKITDVLGRRVTEVLPGIERTSFIERYGEVTLTGIPVSFEEFSGPLQRYYSISAYRVDADIFATVFQDITERKNIDRKLVESEQRFRRLSENADDIIYRYEFAPKRRFTYVSPAATKITGYTPEEHYEDPDLGFKLVHPDDRHLLESLSKGEDNDRTNVTLRWIRKDGQVIWAEQKNVLLYDEEGNLTALEGIARDITERKQVEENLEKERSLLKSLLDSIPDMIFFKDLDGTYLGCNPEFSNFVGRGREEIIGNTDYDLFSKELADFFRENDAIMVEEGKDRHNEEWVDYPDGKKILLDTLKAPLRSSTGKMIGLVGVGRDITYKWYAEQTIKELNLLNQLTLDSLDANICVLDETGTIIKTNKSWNDFAIANSADLEKVSESTNYIQIAKDAKGPDSDLALQFARGIEDVMNGSAESFELEYPCHSPEEERWFIGKVRPFQGANSFPCKVVVSHINITERKKSEQALQAEEARIRAITESTQDAILMMNPAGDISFWNSAAERIFGYVSEEAIGQDLHLLLAPQRYHASYKEKLSIFLKTGLGGAVGKTLELEALHKNGREISIEMSLSSLELSDGWHAVGVMREITERKLAEEKLLAYAEEVEMKNKELDKTLIKAEEATRAKSEFLANMSHEIRTPMNGVIGMTGLLLDTELDEEQIHYVETVQASGEALLDIINDILDFSKIEAGKLELEVLDFDLHSLLDDFASMLSIRAHDKGLEFICAAEPNVPVYIRGDTGRLQQVLINLTGNAVKFTQQGEVAVRVTLESETDAGALLRFSVRDTGIGIHKDKIGSLFGQFYQVDASTTRQYGGTGLGLAISKQLVEMMGGKIGVRSEEGKGSEFWFTAHFAKQPDCDRKKIMSGDVQSARILVVDDNATNREILINQLSSWGSQAKEAVDGPMALQALYKAHEDNEPFQVALLDMQMPGMDGVTLARVIKSDEKLKNTCLIMLSSMGQWSASEQLERSYFEAYLTKPVRQSSLFDKLSSILSMKTEKQRSHSPLTMDLNSKQGINNVRVLLAEDNIVNQKVAQSMLKKLGFRTDTVANGTEALKALETLPYDLVLMDVQMPEMDGMEATKLIRQPGSAVLNREIPIIAMTAHAMIGDRERFIEAGMDDYISKPVSLKSLMELLDKWLTMIQKDVREDSSSAGATETPAKPLVFDREALFERIMDDKELARSLIAIFLKQVPEQIRELRENVDKREMKNILWCAHKIKGTSANLGGMVLSSLASEMEQAAMQGEYNKITTIMLDMEKQFDILVNQLKEV